MLERSIYIIDIYSFRKKISVNSDMRNIILWSIAGILLLWKSVSQPEIQSFAFMLWQNLEMLTWKPFPLFRPDNTYPFKQGELYWSQMSKTDVKKSVFILSCFLSNFQRNIQVPAGALKGPLLVLFVESLRQFPLGHDSLKPSCHHHLQLLNLKGRRRLHHWKHREGHQEG